MRAIKWFVCPLLGAMAAFAVAPDRSLQAQQPTGRQYVSVNAGHTLVTYALRD